MARAAQQYLHLAGPPRGRLDHVLLEVAPFGVFPVIVVLAVRPVIVPALNWYSLRPVISMNGYASSHCSGLG